MKLLSTPEAFDLDMLGLIVEVCPWLCLAFD
jgi:hypothetical protein